jgi:hypothetical protein
MATTSLHPKFVPIAKYRIDEQHPEGKHGYMAPKEIMRKKRGKQTT